MAEAIAAVRFSSIESQVGVLYGRIGVSFEILDSVLHISWSLLLFSWCQWSSLYNGNAWIYDISTVMK